MIPLDDDVKGVILSILSLNELKLAGNCERVRHGRDGLVFRLTAESQDRRPFVAVMKLYRGVDGATRVLREATLQSALTDSGYPTAAVLHHGHLGHDQPWSYLLMAEVPGQPLLGRIGEPGGGDLFRLGSSGVLHELRSIVLTPRLLADAQLKLHTISAAPVLRELRSHGVVLPDARSRLATIREKARSVPVPVLLDALTWLDPRIDSAEPDVVCHGDIQPLNLVMDSRLILRGVVDWTWATVGERALDVGFTFAALRTVPVSASAMPDLAVRGLQTWFSNDYLRSYASFCPVSRERVDVFAVLRASSALASVRLRQRGQLDEPDAVWCSDKGIQRLTAFIAEKIYRGAPAPRNRN